MNIIAHIEGENVNQDDDGRVYYTGAGRIDTDGSGPHHGDPDADNSTSLKLNGQPLNADVDKYIVVPIEVVTRTRGAVLGCQAYVRNSISGLDTFAVVGDIGNRRLPPTTRLGEMSNACAREIGLDPSPTTGGTDKHVIEYQLWPGKAAAVDGKQYELQSFPQ